MLKYRPDIDGLRAIAVGSVVLYHLDESLLSGGFVGVDIFFVISGYLITKLIIGEIVSSGDFSFKNFYLRRIRRLFPALFVTMLFCLCVGYFILSPTHLVELSQSLVSAIFSVSNIFFWSVAGYFDSDSSLKPLLHTWSLSVEEQFYLLWPLILLGLASLRRPRVIPAFIIIVGLLSLLLNEVFFAHQARITAWFGTEDNQAVLNVPSTVFYWLPFRVFEFAIGAILVWPNRSLISRLSKSWRFSSEMIFGIGLAMVIWAIFGFDDKMEFPSSAALVPCVGAALIIFSGPSHQLSLILSNRLMVGVGLISYSLYLIHWPLIVFYRYWMGSDLTQIECVGLVLVALLVAFFMYRLVEQPFRKPKSSAGSSNPANRPFLLGTLFAVIAIVSVSVNAVASKGWLWRYPADMVAQLSYKKGDYTEYFWANIHKFNRDFSRSDKPKVLVVGDSMAAGLMNVLVAGEAHKELDLVSLLVGENCKTMFGLTDQDYQAVYAGAKEICQREHNEILAKSQLFSEADTIILATYWWEEHNLKYIPSTVEYLQTLTAAKVKVLGLKVQQSDGIRFLSKHAFSPQVDKLRTPLNPKARRINQILKRQASNYDYFDLLGLFCNEQGCQRITKERYAIIFDGTHFSEHGARFVAAKLKYQPWFSELREIK